MKKIQAKTNKKYTQKTSMALENPPWMKMYFLLNMGIFQLAMLVFGSVMS